LLGEEDADPPAKQPVELPPSRGGDTPQNHPTHAIRRPFAVRERERASPRPARHQPALDAEAFAQSLDVRDEVRRRVARQIDLGLARVRAAPAAVPLVEQNRPVDLRVEQSTLPRRAARPRTAVQDDSGSPVRVATNLPVHEVALADVEHAVVVGLDRGV
jgi:hypothetical protein